jgi:hypothetical protein
MSREERRRVAEFGNDVSRVVSTRVVVEDRPARAAARVAPAAPAMELRELLLDAARGTGLGLGPHQRMVRESTPPVSNDDGRPYRPRRRVPSLVPSRRPRVESTLAEGRPDRPHTAIKRPSRRQYHLRADAASATGGRVPIRLESDRTRRVLILLGRVVDSLETRWKQRVSASLERAARGRIKPSTIHLFANPTTPGKEPHMIERMMRDERIGAVLE